MIALCPYLFILSDSLTRLNRAEGGGGGGGGGECARNPRYESIVSLVERWHDDEDVGRVSKPTFLIDRVRYAPAVGKPAATAVVS